MKKKIWRAVFLLPLAAALFGCGPTKDEPREITTLDWYINFSWYSTTWGDNLVSDAITEKTGINVNFTAPKGSETEKMNAMISANTLPDLMTLGWWEDACQELIDRDLVYPLNELADEYCPEFYDVVNDTTVQWYTQTDGKIYGYPSSSYTPEDLERYDNVYSNQNFLVRKDIYEALGAPDMTTPEGFMDAVRRAAKEFPVVEGEPLIPIGSDEFTENGCNSFDNYLLSFLAVPYEKDGNYYDRYLDADYLSWLKVFRQLGEEGCLKDDIFIDKRSQLEDKISDGRYFCLFYQSMDIAAPQRILKREHPERVYIAVDGPKNSRGDDPVLPVAGVHGWTVTMIPKTCKDPEKAIKFLTYLISEEGQKMIFLGVEGEMYEMVDGKPVVKQEVIDLLNEDRVAYDEKYGADDTYWMLQNNAMQLQWEYNEGDPVAEMKQYTMPYVTYTGQYDMDFSQDREIAKKYTAMQKLWGTSLKRLLLAKDEKEFDQIIKEYQKERNAAGYREVAEAAGKMFRINKEKLGIKDEK